MRSFCLFIAACSIAGALCSCSSTTIISVPDRNLPPATTTAMNEQFKKSLTTIRLRNFGGTITREAGRIILRRDTICAYPERRNDTLYYALQDIEHIRCAPQRVVPYLAGGAILGGIGGYLVSQLTKQERGFATVSFSVLGAIAGITTGASLIHDTEFHIEKAPAQDSVLKK